MSRTVTLVRHTQVARRWAARCYGSSDPPLSREGRRAATTLAKRLAAEPIDLLIHSGLRRAEYLAEKIAELTDVAPQVDCRWRERDFFSWEGRTWNSVWRESCDEMDGMLTRPRVYRPGGGETTEELTKRALAAWKALPHGQRVVVITHGGPIAVVRAYLARQRLHLTMRKSVKEGAIVRLPDTERG